MFPGDLGVGFAAAFVHEAGGGGAVFEAVGMAEFVEAYFYEAWQGVEAVGGDYSWGGVQVGEAHDSPVGVGDAVVVALGGDIQGGDGDDLTAEVWVGLFEQV